VHTAWSGANEYRVVPIPRPVLFEGGGDALWHPSCRLIWDGYGFRASREAYERLQASWMFW
jgi:hypothetical protein